jgi:aspartate carbamoyltransferase catalytic subunit
MTGTDKSSARSDPVPVFGHKDLLGIRELTPGEITLLLDTAEAFHEVSLREIKKVPTLRGKTVVHLFFEPSTRTRTSFEIAAKRLSADTVTISVATSSLVKGETLMDTALTLEAMAPDALVIRHPSAGVPHQLAERLAIPVINAGDGAHEHPTQALLDAFTIRRRKGRIAGLKVAIIGDIRHSRVARSNTYLLTKLGARVFVSGPLTLIPPAYEKLVEEGVTVTLQVEEALEGADVIIALRLQRERQQECFFPSVKEYAARFGLTPDRLRLAKDDVIVLHPGPLNRGVEISSLVADGPASLILEQVSAGVAVRMAVLYLLIGGEKRMPGPKVLPPEKTT